MGWERRKGSSGRYYTRSKRVRGRVRREYIGCREAAHLMAEMDALARESRAIRREIVAERRREEQAQRDAMYAEIMGPLDALDVMCRVEMRRELEAAGYHQHDRGEWRKRRKQHGEAEKELSATRDDRGVSFTRGEAGCPATGAGREVATTTGATMVATTWTAQEQHELVALAYGGDKSALPELRAMLEAHPEVVRAQGDLSRDAHLAMVMAVAGGNTGLPEVLARRAAQVRADLEGAHPTALERLLCERVATCWLAVYLLDAVTMVTSNGQRPPARVVEHHERMRDSAQKRYLEACVALAKVRRLLRPSVQVNIAQAGAQQLNVGYGAAEMPLLPGECGGE